jgi:hypothetical protein
MVSCGAFAAAPGLSSSPVLAALVLTTVDGVEALSPISRHMSRAACVRLFRQWQLFNFKHVFYHCDFEHTAIMMTHNMSRLI